MSRTKEFNTFMLSLILVFLFSSACVASMSGQLTDIDVVEVQKVNGFLVISGMSNDSDPSHVNCSNRGVRIFVNKFVTHTHPQGGWRVCIPCSFAEYDKDKGYKLEILAEDLNCATTLHNVLYVQPTKRSERKIRFQKLYHQQLDKK